MTRVLLAVALMAQAQPQPAPRSARPDPIDAHAQVPSVA